MAVQKFASGVRQGQGSVQRRGEVAGRSKATGFSKAGDRGADRSEDLHSDASKAGIAPGVRAESRPEFVGDSASLPGLNALEDLIEAERARLMTAHSIMSCVAVAMEAEEVGSGHGPYYPGLIELARDLVNESIGRLDTLAVAPLFEAAYRGKSVDYSQRIDAPVDSRARHEVREAPPAGYLC